MDTKIRIKNTDRIFFVETRHAGKGEELRRKIEEEFSSSVTIFKKSNLNENYTFFVKVPSTKLQEFMLFCEENGATT